VRFALPRLRNEDETDGEPNDDQAGEDPEQERRFADWEPRQLASVEEELRATGGLSVSVVLDDLAPDGVRRLEGGLAFGVDIADLAARTRAYLSCNRHEFSLPTSANPLAVFFAKGGVARCESR
jgi:hypothetical protein